MRRHCLRGQHAGQAAGRRRRVAGAQVVPAAARMPARRTTRPSSSAISTRASRRRTRSSPATTPCAAPVGRSRPAAATTRDEIEAMSAARPGRGAGVRDRSAEAAAARRGFPAACLNIHLGLSPYYRGAGTNFWPLVNGEPEYCGATIHFLDERRGLGADHRARPARDRSRATARMTSATRPSSPRSRRWRRGRAGTRPGPLPSTPQARRRPRLSSRADFSADAVRRLYDNFERGMIAEYLAQRARAMPRCRSSPWACPHDAGDVPGRRCITTCATAPRRRFPGIRALRPRCSNSSWTGCRPNYTLDRSRRRSSSRARRPAGRCRLERGAPDLRRRLHAITTRRCFPSCARRGLSGTFFVAEETRGLAPRRARRPQDAFPAGASRRRRVRPRGAGRRSDVGSQSPADGRRCSGPTAGSTPTSAPIKHLLNYELPSTTPTRVLDALFTAASGRRGGVRAPALPGYRCRFATWPPAA